MLGGYYLGQLYLGISGLPAGGTLSPQGASHQLSSDNINLTQKHTIVVANTTHAVISQKAPPYQPDGYGGGWGAIDGFGVAEFGGINILLPLNYLILAEDSRHTVTSPELDNFIQIFNMIRTGEYKKDFGSQGDIGSEYTKDTGTMPVKQGNFGQITPVPESNQGLFIVEIGTSGSYTQNGKTNGILTSGNSSSGSYSTDEKDTGNYIKIK